MDIGVTQTLSAVVKQPSGETKFWAAAALCNLPGPRLRRAPRARGRRERSARTPSTDASSRGRGRPGDEIYLQCVTALYNMAQGSGKTDEKLVEDGAVPLLESLLETTDPTILEPRRAIQHLDGRGMRRTDGRGSGRVVPHEGATALYAPTRRGGL